MAVTTGNPPPAFGMICPKCHTPYHNPHTVTLGKRLSLREEAALASSGALNRICLACHALYTIYRPTQRHISVMGCDPSMNEWLLPTKNGSKSGSNGEKCPELAALSRKRFAKVLKLSVEYLREIGYSRREAAERLQVEEGRLKRVWPKD
jgi:hypothetical protein